MTDWSKGYKERFLLTLTVASCRIEFEADDFAVAVVDDACNQIAVVKELDRRKHFDIEAARVAALPDHFQVPQLASVPTKRPMLVAVVATMRPHFAAQIACSELPHGLDRCRFAPVDHCVAERNAWQSILTVVIATHSGHTRQTQAVYWRNQRDDDNRPHQTLTWRRCRNRVSQSPAVHQLVLKPCYKRVETDNQRASCNTKRDTPRAGCKEDKSPAASPARKLLARRATLPVAAAVVYCHKCF